MIRYAILAAFTALLIAIILWAGRAPMTPLPQALAALSIAALSVHAIITLGSRNAVIFAAITLAVTFGIENIGVSTGFPFGSYHFVVGAKLPHVGAIPLIVGPLYFAMGYASFVIACLIAGRGANFVVRAITAALVMTQWDLVMDPVNATINGLWIWHDGGSYFGVPLSNFAGWFGEMLLVFLLAAPWLKPDLAKRHRSFWFFPILLYIAAGASQIAPWLLDAEGISLDGSGHSWPTGAIHAASVLIFCLTMLPSGALALWRLHAKSKP